MINLTLTLNKRMLAAFFENARVFFYDKSGICTLAEADPVQMSAAHELSRDIEFSPNAYLYTMHDPRTRLTQPGSS